LLLGGAATLGAVTAAAEQHGILHFATHGLAFAEKPLDSFLLLADNGDAAEASLWRARAAQTLNLRADLVTLSACQTGLGQISGDGVLGLSRAFLVAGARAVLVSQWRISDQATALLMDAFYEAYVAVDDKALALQVAMAKVRQNHRFRQPRYWAGFAIIGAEA
jgi:CHAT domain-containing protein